jgi:hypothetical protein
MFNWFKTPTVVKKTIVLKHKNGGDVKITIEGENYYHVSHISNKINLVFGCKENIPNTGDTWKQFDKLFAEFNKLMDSFNGKK